MAWLLGVAAALVAALIGGLIVLSADPLMARYASRQAMRLRVLRTM